MISISNVERDLGISKDTLRTWERRYDFPSPHRNAKGERIYPPEQVEKLRSIKRLIDQGVRPAKIISLSLNELRELTDKKSIEVELGLPTEDATNVSHLKGLLSLIKKSQVDEFKSNLTRQLIRQGLENFVSEHIAPLTILVGEEWLRGDLAVHNEHFFTECVTGILRQAISSVKVTNNSESPRILLTTFPNELHSLGLLMAECMMTLEDARCISLGTQTPIMEIINAIQSHQAHILALSFSAASNQRHVIDGLHELRRELPENIEIWAGGSCPALKKINTKGILVLNNLNEIKKEVRLWKKNHPEI